MEEKFSDKTRPFSYMINERLKQITKTCQQTSGRGRLLPLWLLCSPLTTHVHPKGGKKVEKLTEGEGNQFRIVID